MTPEKLRTELLKFDLSSTEASDGLIQKILKREPHPGVSFRSWTSRLARRLGGELVFTGHKGRRFLVTDFLQEGGFGETYRALALEPPYDWVCIKFAHFRALERDGQQKIIEDFQREAESLEGLSHPSLVRLETYGKTDDETPFLVMEYVKGTTLSGTSLDAWSLEQRFTFFHQLVDGLAYLHSLNRFHGDLSPRNILVDEAGDARIIDFGMASTTASISNSLSHHTVAVELSQGFSQPLRIRGVRGTPGYIAPEVAACGPPTRKSDLFSLGCILYFLMNHDPPAWQGNIQVGQYIHPGGTRSQDESAPDVAWDTSSHGAFLARSFDELVAYHPDHRSSIRDLQNRLEELSLEEISINPIICSKGELWEELYRSPEYTPTPSQLQLATIKLRSECATLSQKQQFAFREMLARIAHVHWFSAKGNKMAAEQALQAHVSRLQPFVDQTISCTIHRFHKSIGELEDHLETKDILEEQITSLYHQAATSQSPDWQRTTEQAWNRLLQHAANSSKWVTWSAAWSTADSAIWSATYSTAYREARSAAWNAAWSTAYRMARSAARLAVDSVAWNAALSTAGSAAGSAAKLVADSVALFTARNTLLPAARSAAYSAAYSTAWGIFLEEPNPFTPLWFVFQLGFLPIELINGDFLLVIPEPEQ